MMADRVRSAGDVLSPRQLAEACLDAVGMFEVSETTLESLVALSAQWGDVRFDQEDALACSRERVVEMLQLIVASREYQLA